MEELAVAGTGRYELPVKNAKIYFAHGPATDQRYTITEPPSLSLYSRVWPAPKEMADVIVEHLEPLEHVRCVMLGRSGSVYHAWVVTQKWTAEARREIYARQQLILDVLRGFEIDFYLLRLDAGERADGLSWGLPAIYEK